LPLFDTLVEGFAKLIGLERIEPARERAVALPTSEPLPEPEPQPEDSGDRAERSGAAQPEGDPEIRLLIDEAMATLPKAVAVGVVDLGLRALLGMRTVDNQPATVIARLGTATRDFFSQRYFTASEEALCAGSEPQPRQIVVLSANLVHLFARLEQRPQAVLVAVCRADTNLGLALTRLRTLAGAPA
jgi:hypothetical protein